jgi:hypothetical protein
MEDRFAGVRLLGPPEVDGEFVRLSDGSVVHLHAYERIYAVPGLYEYVVQERLGCRSPQVACEGLMRAVSSLSINPAALTVLDLGAGTGLVGELVRGRGVSSVVGLDPLGAAREACSRDRPGVYRDYLVGDLACPDSALLARLRASGLGGMVSAGAFGGGTSPARGSSGRYDDQPSRAHGSPAVLVNVLGLLPAGAPVVFTIDERWMRGGEPDGFGPTVGRLVGEGRLGMLERSRFRHRVTTSGEPIYYELIVAATAAGDR